MGGGVGLKGILRIGEQLSKHKMKTETNAMKTEICRMKNVMTGKKNLADVLTPPSLIFCLPLNLLFFIFCSLLDCNLKSRLYG